MSSREPPTASGLPCSSGCAPGPAGSARGRTLERPARTGAQTFHFGGHFGRCGNRRRFASEYLRTRDRSHPGAPPPPVSIWFAPLRCFSLLLAQPLWTPEKRSENLREAGGIHPSPPPPSFLKLLQIRNAGERDLCAGEAAAFRWQHANHHGIPAISMVQPVQSSRKGLVALTALGRPGWRHV